MTVRNYAGTCPQSVPLYEEARAKGNLSARMLHLIADSYRDSQERPYIHLVDGGLVDNLGVRGLLDRAISSGSLNASFGLLPPGSVRKIVLISVNSERDTADRIDSSDRVPSNLQVLDALVFGAGSRLTTETTAMVNDVTRRLSEELRADRRRPGSPFAPDADLHVINVSLRELRDTALRQTLLRVPTALTILPIQVRQLQAAGRQALRESPEFQRLSQDLAHDIDMAELEAPAVP
jgi:NTE family protein